MILAVYEPVFSNVQLPQYCYHFYLTFTTQTSDQQPGTLTTTIPQWPCNEESVNQALSRSINQ